VLAGQRLGIKEVDDGIWLVSFMHCDLGYFDLEQKTLRSSRQPVRHEVVTHVSGLDNVTLGSGGALPPFPTPAGPAISHPILRLRLFVPGADPPLTLLETHIETSRSSILGESGRIRGNSKSDACSVPPSYNRPQSAQSQPVQSRIVMRAIQAKHIDPSPAEFRNRRASFGFWRATKRIRPLCLAAARRAAQFTA